MDLVKAARTCFSKDYAESRRRFLKAAKSARVPVKTYANPNKGPAGEALGTDVAWIGSKTAPKVLILLTGTHGVEGFCGAGALMDFWATRPKLPRDVAVLAIHAINPHGFAWLRRVTEEGCDLNRNFVDFANPPENPGYDELADAILPPAIEGPESDAAEARIKAYIDKHGLQALNVAFSGGQYKHAKGLFFGGFGPTWSHMTHAAIIEDFALAGRKAVAVLDYHTGLGPHGYGEIISAHTPGSAWGACAKAWYGDLVTEPLAGTSTAGARHGFTSWIYERKLGKKLANYMAIEYGTYDSMTVVRKALIADHWLHVQRDFKWSDSRSKRIKAQIRKAFYPDTDQWREDVLFRSRQMIRFACEGLAKA